MNVVWGVNSLFLRWKIAYASVETSQFLGEKYK